VDRFSGLGCSEGRCHPTGKFFPEIPPLSPGMKYRIRMIVMVQNGERYESEPIEYPPSCIDLSLDIAYSESNCSSISGLATLTSNVRMSGFTENISLNELSYSIQKPEGLQVLRQFDLTTGGWGSVELNTLNLPAGSYPIRATLSYLDLTENRIVEVSTSNSLSVDRILPVAQMTYPGKSMKLCPTKVSDSTAAWYAIPVEGVAKDNSKVEIQYYEVYYGVGENPSIWVPATTRKRGELLPFIEKGRSVQGELGLWDITGIKGEIFP
jgi:hypothetical protein